MSEGQGNITTGDITGQGIAVGHGASANVQITQGNLAEIVDALAQLRSDIAAADLPEGAKKVILEKAVPEMEEAVNSPEPRTGLERGLERINDQLEGVGAAAEKVPGILDSVKKIAKAAGVTLSVVAPFLAGLL